MRQTIIVAAVAAIVTVIVNVVALTQFGADTARSASVADTSVSGNLPSSEEGQIQGDTDCDVLPGLDEGAAEKVAAMVFG